MALPTCGQIRRVTTQRFLAQCVLYMCHVTSPCSTALQSAAFSERLVAFPAESVTLGCQTFLRLKGYPKTNPSCFPPSLPLSGRM